MKKFPLLLNDNATMGGGLIRNGLKLWLDASDQSASSMEIISNKCKTWYDKSGNGNHFEKVDSNHRPATNTRLLNGKSVLTFDGTNDHLSAIGSGLFEIANANSTIFCVSRQTSVAQQRLITFATAANSTRLNLRYKTTEGVEFINNAVGTIATAPAPIYTNDFNIIHALHNGTTQSVGANGGVNTGNTSATNQGSIAFVTIGADGQGTTNFLGGDIAEIIIFSRALATNEHAQIVRYLNRKWGVMIAGTIDFSPILPTGKTIPAVLTYDGYTTSHDMDVAIYANSISTQYYTATTGNNANSGLTLPLATQDIDAVIGKGNTTALPYGALVTAGIFNRNQDWTVTPTRAFNCIGSGGDAIMDSYQPFATMTADGTAYKATRSAVGQVYDSTIVDANGTQERLTLVANVATCQATPGSWYTNNVDVWVRTSDSRDLSIDSSGVRVRLSVIGARNTADVPMYLENMNFYGWKDQGFYTSNAGSSTALYAKNCEFAYAIDSNNLTVQGTNTVILQGCVARDSYLDGLNYHIKTGFESIRPNIYEFDCLVYDCGYAAGSANYSNNASTLHDGLFGFRMKGTYYGSGGRNVQDIGIGTVSINLDCIAGNSRGGDVNSSVDWMVSDGNPGDTATMYLVRCRSTGSSTPVRVEVDGVIYCNAGSNLLYQSANIIAIGGTLASFAPRII